MSSFFYKAKRVQNPDLYVPREDNEYGTSLSGIYYIIWLIIMIIICVYLCNAQI